MINRYRDAILGRHSRILRCHTQTQTEATSQTVFYPWKVLSDCAATCKWLQEKSAMSCISTFQISKDENSPTVLTCLPDRRIPSLLSRCCDTTSSTATTINTNQQPYHNDVTEHVIKFQDSIQSLYCSRRSLHLSSPRYSCQSCILWLRRIYDRSLRASLYTQSQLWGFEVRPGH